ncbi:MAG: VWA domain-containing protein [Azoarcus sp.]|jgi:nitric oxide reductase NorD protein|nr:VWA domain-containing protein [Azoarcus sp.]
MEVWIGRLWHRIATRAAEGSGARTPAAAVRLEEVTRALGVFFRALGGDAGLRLAAATEDRHTHRRRWLARVASSGERLFLARRDAGALRLPPVIDVFPETALNRDLYYWLAALAACPDESFDDAGNASVPGVPGFWRNQAASARVLRDWPGLAPRYQRLVAAYLPRRMPPHQLPPGEAEREAAIRQALLAPGSVAHFPAHFPERPANTPPAEPVLLWLQPGSPEALRTAGRTGASQNVASGGTVQDDPAQAHKAERVEMPHEKNGILLPFRAESLLSLAEFFKINRSVDDEEQPDAHAARDLERLSLSRPEDKERIASRVRFDLDLPSAAEDDERLGEGLPFPEWDYRASCLREKHAFVQDMRPRQTCASAALPQHLSRLARRLRERFAVLQGGRVWRSGQPDGEEPDLEAVVRAHTDRLCRRTPDERLYRAMEKRERDLACLLLADLSLSTDTWVSNTARVIDVIRDAMLLFGEALRATGDRFALCGFSSVKRHHVRFQRFKDFDENFDGAIRGRILAVRPGYYTRMGAAIRRASRMLTQETATRRLLLILSDGKPNDLDLYDSRYGIEDTRMAVLEARRAGLLPFCLTIDRKGGGYLNRLFGPAGYAMLRKPEELPQRLPMLYAQLTTR